MARPIAADAVAYPPNWDSPQSPASRATGRKGIPGPQFGMQAYKDCFGGKLVDQGDDEGELGTALAGLPSVKVT